MRKALREILRFDGRGRATPREHRLLFAFTGGSGAWPGMGCTLYRQEPVFREAIEASSAIVEQILGWSPVPLFRGAAAAETTIELERRNEIIHLGILQLGQVDLWRAEGITPGGVVSVSLGEMVAPYAARALSRDDCARVLAVVAHAISRTQSDERMFVLEKDEIAAQHVRRIAPIPVEFLGAMTPRLTVVLSRGSDADAIRAYLGASVVRELRTDWCYHTPRLDVDRAWMREQLRDLKSMPPICPIYSAAAGGAIADDAPFDAQFFAWMVSRPFHFAGAVSAAFDEGFDAVVNVGPQPANNHYIAAIAQARAHDIRLIDSMRANEEESSWARAKTELRSLRVQSTRKRTAVSARTLDLADPTLAARLFEVYEELRRRGSAHFLQRHGFYLVLGYDDVKRALADGQHFSSRLSNLTLIDPVLLGNDPPDHTAIRQIVSRRFSAEALAQRSVLAEQTAERLLQPLAGGHELDVVHDFAVPLARAIAADVVGFDDDCVAGLVEPTLAAAGRPPRVYENLHGPIDAIAHRSSIYGDVLQDAAGLLDANAARSLVRLLWIAGTTPERAVSSAVLLLLQHGDIRSRVQSSPELMSAFIDEVLRLRPPAHLLPRLTMADMKVGGTSIPKGSVVQLCLAAANRDPARFADPEELRLDRASNPHLSFGGGIHRCIGAPLAHVQMAAALSALFRLAPRFRAVQPLGTVAYEQRESFRQLKQLVIGP